MQFTVDKDGTAVCYRNPRKAFFKLGWAVNRNVTQSAKEFSAVKMGKAIALLNSLGSHPTIREIVHDMAKHCADVYPPAIKTYRLIRAAIESRGQMVFAEAPSGFEKSVHSHFMRDHCFTKYFTCFSTAIEDIVEKNHGPSLRKYRDLVRADPWCVLDGQDFSFTWQEEKKPKTFAGTVHRVVDIAHYHRPLGLGGPQ